MTETESVHCAVGTGSLYIKQICFVFKGSIAVFALSQSRQGQAHDKHRYSTVGFHAGTTLVLPDFIQI
jgi:hypothetical protein